MKFQQVASTLMLVTCIFAGSVAEAKPALRRFALIAGANNGGPKRVLLRYAASDARSFADVLHGLGGVTRDDSIVLLNPSMEDFTGSFDKLGDMVKSGQDSAERTEVVVYYSGHSDEQGLLLGEHRLSYSWLRQELKELGADVRVVVLDSCSSGALTRRKGGTLLPPFVLDTSSDVSGHAFITSSSATEAAQESDAIAGSFFTHYLVTGMRGAADGNSDGRVTLTEAYQFAFDETLARTESTQIGPQHPNYDFQLAGAGNLVMTDISASSARLVLDAVLTGRVSVRDSDGHLVAELRKVPGKVVGLGLAPGRYDVSVATAQGLIGGSIDIKAGKTANIGDMTLVSIGTERTVPRGGLLEKDLALAEEYEVQIACFGLFPGFGTCPKLDRKATRKTSVSLFWDQVARVHGFQGSAIVAVTQDELAGVQVAGVVGINAGALDGAQFAGVMSMTAGSADGIQGAGAVSIIGGSLRGAQISGSTSVLRGNAPRALQLAGAVNIAASDEFRGMQGAGAVNFLKGDLLGGLQVAGAVNIAGSLKGTQVAGATNYAGRLDGLQVAAVNISGDVTGAQIGVINIAVGDVKGAQVGVINIANDYQSGGPVGLFNFVRKGQLHVDMWASDMLTSNVSLKFGSDHVYTLLTAGARPQWSDARGILGAGLGLGGMLNFTDNTFGALDLTAYAIEFVDPGERVEDVKFEGQKNSFFQLRLMVGHKWYEHLGIFGGIALNSWMEFDGDRPPRDVAWGLDFTERDGNFVRRTWPGAFLGVQL